MTTIACNRKEMAADSLFTFDDAGVGAFPTRKLYRIADSIFGEAGEDNSSSRMIRWLVNGRREDERPHFDKNEKNACILIELSPEGIHVWDHELFPYPVREDTFAIGSGRKVALYCMRVLNMSPEQAVKEACKVDHGTREPIDVERLPE